MKISIVTAAHRSAATLRNAIESVLAQTYKDIEYIIVDSGTGDGTAELVAHYAPRFDGRLVFISEPDHGAYDAMNKGISRATGDVVGILNSDDYFTTVGVLAQVARTMTQSNVDAVYGDVHYVSPARLDRCVRYYSSQQFTPQRMRMGFMPAHPSFYCRREVYQRYGAFDTTYKVAADFELLLRLIYVAGITTTYIPLDFVTMRTGGLSNSGWRSHLQIMRDHRRALRAHHVSTSYLRLSLRYGYKVADIVKARVKSMSRSKKH